MPHGYLTYWNANEGKGLLDVESATMTLMPGIQPSVCRISTVPQPADLPLTGTVTWKFEGHGYNVQIPLTNCAVDLASLRFEARGALWTIEIKDRRWKWAFGHISGRYNRRDAKGDIVAATEKTPQELATLCLDAMGETDYDVSQLPGNAPETGPRPEVDWDYTNPAEALQAICDDLGCRVVLRLDDTVQICAIGTGATLPTNDVISRANTLDTKIRPSTIRIVGGPVRFQSRLLLEAVGLDNDGDVKALASLSYYPAGGFKQPGYHLDVTDEDDRKLAVQTVYKWYRIKSQADGTQDLPGSDHGSVTGIEKLLPLYGSKIETETVHGIEKPQKATIEGTFYSENVFDEVDTDKLFDGPFSIDNERGIVQFSSPVFTLSGGTFAPATLYLTVSYSARDVNDLLVRYIRDRSVTNPTDTTDEQMIYRDDIERTIIANYASYGAAPSSVTDNETDCDDEADYYLDQAIAALANQTQADGRYAGLIALNVDGVIEQVTWDVSGAGAYTSVSVDSRSNPWAPSYKQIADQQKKAASQKETTKTVSLEKRRAARGTS